jgi:hypothetical protein
LFIYFLKIGFVRGKHVTSKLDSGIVFISCTHEQFESLELQLGEIKLSNIQHSNSLDALLLFMKIELIIDTLLVGDFELFIFEFLLDFVNGSLGIGVVYVYEIGFIKIGDGAIEGLLMKCCLSAFPPKSEPNLL